MGRRQTRRPSRLTTTIQRHTQAFGERGKERHILSDSQCVESGIHPTFGHSASDDRNDNNSSNQTVNIDPTENKDCQKAAIASQSGEDKLLALCSFIYLSLSCCRRCEIEISYGIPSAGRPIHSLQFLALHCTTLLSTLGERRHFRRSCPKEPA